MGMRDLTSEAAAILASMEPNRPYEVADLYARFPDNGMDGLREIMHDLWVRRSVERSGYTGWRRQVSTCASKFAPDPRSCASCPITRSCAHAAKKVPGEVIRTAQLLDQPEFAGMFK